MATTDVLTPEAYRAGARISSALSGIPKFVDAAGQRVVNGLNTATDATVNFGAGVLGLPPNPIPAMAERATAQNPVSQGGASADWASPAKPAVVAPPIITTPAAAQPVTPVSVTAIASGAQGGALNDTLKGMQLGQPVNSNGFSIGPGSGHFGNSEVDAINAGIRARGGKNSFDATSLPAMAVYDGPTPTATSGRIDPYMQAALADMATAHQQQTIMDTVRATAGMPEHVRTAAISAATSPVVAGINAAANTGAAAIHAGGSVEAAQVGAGASKYASDQTLAGRNAEVGEQHYEHATGSVVTGTTLGIDPVTHLAIPLPTYGQRPATVGGMPTPYNPAPPAAARPAPKVGDGYNAPDGTYGGVKVKNKVITSVN